MPTKKYLREPATCELTELKKQTLRNWRHKGIGPPYRKVGSAVLYEESEVIAWIESQRVETAPLRKE
jgi:predicted DNA-binding transcriptional regulator AlpA